MNEITNKSKEDYRHNMYGKALKETLEVSTVHSLPNIIRNKYVSIKILWILSLTASLSICAYFMCQQFISYFNYDVVSTVKELYKLSIPFPVVTICNINYFVKNESELGDEFDFIFNQSSSVSFLNASFRLKFFTSQYVAVTMSDFLNDSIKNQMSYSLNQTIISCIFALVDCSLNSDFIEYFDPVYGRCFQYNFDKSKSLPFPGSNNGLRLELMTQSVDTNNNMYTMNNGFFIYINNFRSFNSADFDGIAISNGFSTNIMLKYLSFKKQGRPYSDCIADLTSIDSYSSDVYKKTFYFNKNTYTRELCLNMCFQIFIGKSCGCYGVTSGPFPSNLRPCLNETDQICDNYIWNKFIKDLNCDCPYECQKKDYSYNILGYVQYPTRAYSDVLLRSPVIQARLGDKASYNEIKKSVAEVSIFVGEMIETAYIESVKTTLIDLISNIGGILSLFIGVSVISFIEIFEVIIQTLFIFVEKYKLRKK